MTGDGWRRRSAPDSLGARLRAVELPDAAAAEERGWRVLRAAAAERDAGRIAARPRGWRAPRPRAVVVSAFAALVLLALTPPGGAVADWVRDTIGRSSPPARVPAQDALGSLPGGGRLLVQSHAGVWVVRADGSRRLLGGYEEPTWSPRGLFVGVTDDDGLLALTPGGKVRWALARRGADSPRWSPSGFRVAYRQYGALRVVAGDGTGDKLLARDLGLVAPAWQPAFKLHTLATADRRGRVVLIDADSGRRLWRSQPGAHPLSLAWSADGQRLLAVTPHSLRLFDAFGRELVRQPLPAGATAGAAAFAPRGRTFALVRRLSRAGGDEVVQLRAGRAAVVDERLVFRGAGRLGELAWSPDGRWLAIGWPSADQWLFVRPGSRAEPRAAPHIARQFDPGAKGPAPAPAIAGWCCPS